MVLSGGASAPPLLRSTWRRDHEEALNYQKIYDQLIADRRANPPSSDEYVEVHHILPRCMGGTDEPKNLIRLRPEDHFFAHLLLAQVHQTRDAWSACILMSGNRWSDVYRARKTYGLVRRRWNEISRGVNAPNADTSEYTFYHLDGDVFTGTRIEFEAYADVPAASVNNLVRGVSDSSYEWYLSPKARAEHDAEKTERAVAAGKKLTGFVRDKARRHFYHRDNDISAIATQIGMREMFGLSSSAISALIKGSRAVSSGWCLLENAEWAYEYAEPKRGALSSSYNPTKYFFVNDIDGSVRHATINEMGVEFNRSDSRVFGELIIGRKGAWRGWRLHDARPARVQGRKYTLYNNGSAISGTQHDLMRIIGVTQMAISNVVTGKKPHTKGWSLSPANDNQPTLRLSA